MIEQIINEIWRIYNSQGVADDARIIEEVSQLLLIWHETEWADIKFEVNGGIVRVYRHPDTTIHTVLTYERLDRLLQLLRPLFHEVSAADFLNRHLLFHPNQMLALGRYPTARHITGLMRDLTIALTHVESVADFACGSGGFLAEFADVQQLTGVEIAPTLGRIAAANLALHNLKTESIIIGDSLSVVGSRITKSFDAVVMNPPFGHPMEKELVWQRLGEGKGTRSETVLTLLALDHLKAGGVLSVLLPGGSLFATSSGEVTLRRRLLEECQLEAVIELPKDALQPYSQLTTYLVLARREPSYDPVWFYRVSHDGFSSGRNRQPQPEQSQLPLLTGAVAAPQEPEDYPMCN